MSKAVQPAYNHDDQTHWFIWHVMAHYVTEEDFQAIQTALLKREDTIEMIDKSCVEYVAFEEGMLQPREVPQFKKKEALRYTDWSCAFDICMILSKYAKFFSKLD